MGQFPSVAETGRIAALPNPVLRNLLITQSYFELSAAIAGRTGSCANWCSFATWASKQAGQTIRGEDLARALEQVLAGTPGVAEAISDLVKTVRLQNARHSADAIRQLVWEAIDPKAAMTRAGEAVARGNQKVFAEIGHEFARFAAEFLEDESFDAEKIARFCASLRPGAPPEGQQYLREAFLACYRAFFEPDPKVRAEYLLLANLEIGFHEQTRLQPEIAGALEASVIDPYVFARRLAGILFPYRGWIVFLVWQLLRLFGQPARLDAAIKRLVGALRSQVRLFLTDHLMMLALPHRTLRLGEDLSAGFPETLRKLVYPDLKNLLQQVDPTPDSLRSSGAVDWANLPDRMHFIADLFRCYQETPELLGPPFTSEQVVAMKAGYLPEGKL